MSRPTVRAVLKGQTFKAYPLSIRTIGTLAPMYSMVICKGLVWVAHSRGRSSSKKLRAQLKCHSLSSCGPLPLVSLGFCPFIVKALFLLSWAFIRMHLGIFKPLSQTWAYNVFITFELPIRYSLFHHFFSWNSSLARIHCGLPLKVYETLIILGLGMQQRGPRLGKFILALKDVGS